MTELSEKLKTTKNKRGKKELCTKVSKKKSEYRKVMSRMLG